MGGQPVDYTNPVHLASSWIDAFGGDRQKAADYVNRVAARTPKSATQNPVIAEAGRLILSGDELPPYSKGGHMYEVGIDAAPEEMINWDRPLSDPGQPAGVRAFLDSKYGEGFYDRYVGQNPGASIRDLQENFDDLSPDELSQGLLGHGVKGIRFLDAGSRDAGKGTSNYVIFDPKTVEILRRYGIAGMAGGGAAAGGLLADTGEAAAGEMPQQDMMPRIPERGAQPQFDMAPRIPERGAAMPEQDMPTNADLTLPPGMSPEEFQMLAQEPEILQMLLDAPEGISIDENGNAVRTGRRNRYSADDIRAAHRNLVAGRADAAEDPSFLRNKMRGGLETNGAPESLRNKITSDMDWVPFWGDATGLEDAGRMIGNAGSDASRGEYAKAGMEAGLAGLTGLLGLPPGSVKTARRFMRGLL